MGVVVGIYGRVLNAEELEIVSNLIPALEQESCRISTVCSVLHSNQATPKSKGFHKNI